MDVEGFDLTSLLSISIREKVEDKIMKNEEEVPKLRLSFQKPLRVQTRN